MRFSFTIRSLLLGLLPLFALSPGKTAWAQAPLPPITIRKAPVGWRTSNLDSARRTALVVGASSAQDPRAALKGAAPAAKELSRLLRLFNYEVKTLTGKDVTPGRIEDEIKLLTAGMQSAGNHLIVAWIGHGYQENGAQVFSHALSSWVERVDKQGNRSEGVDESLAYSDLLGWVTASQTRVAHAGGELSTLMWTDACRDGSMGFGSATFSRNETLATLQMFSAGRGKKAFTNENGLPYFTSGLIAEMERIYQPPGGAKGRQPIELFDVLTRAMKVSAELRKQEPEWLGRNDLNRFILYDPAHLSMTVRAVDSVTGAHLDGATLTFQDMERSGSSLATFDGLIPSEDGYYWSIHAPGYFGRSGSIALPEVKSGKIMEVPLSPAFIAVEGNVTLENGAGKLLKISLEGLDPPSERFTLTGQGHYRLRAHPGADVCELVVRLGNTVLHREPLSLRNLASPRRVGDVDIQVVVRDPLRLTTTTSTPPGAGMVERKIGSIAVSFDFGSFTRDDFYTGWRSFGRIRDHADGSNFKAAISSLEALGGDNVKSVARERFHSLKAELELSLGLQNAAALQEEALMLRGQGKHREARALMDRAINFFAEEEQHGAESSEEEEHSEEEGRADDHGDESPEQKMAHMAHAARVRPVLTSWLLVSAQDWYSLHEHERSLDQLERLKDLGYDANSLADQWLTVASDWFQSSLQQALMDGDWTIPRAIVSHARKEDMAKSAVDRWQARIARESISFACRDAFTRGKAHHADGQRELARSAYIEALSDPTITESYRETIVPLVLQMEDDLFVQYEKVAFEKSREDPGGSLQAYLKIVEFETTLQHAVSLLVEENPELKAADGMETYRARAGWRATLQKSRRMLARGLAVESFQLVVKGMAAGPYDREGAVFMLARTMAKANSGERARMAEVREKWNREATRIMGAIERAISSGRFEVAQRKLEKARRLPQMDVNRVNALEQLLELAVIKEMEETTATTTLAEVNASISAGLFNYAEWGLRKARRLPRVDLERLQALEKSLAAALVEVEVRTQLRLLEDREAYSRLGKSQVELLARAAQSNWKSQFAGFSLVGVEKFLAGGKSHWVSVWLHSRTGLEFVLLPGGRFRMGSPSTETGRDNEKLHWETLDPFLIARTECTQGAWAKVAGSADIESAPSHFKGSSRLPVETVSWNDVDKWCRAAGLQLPTEVQWEFACRAGTTTAYTYGDLLSSSRARIDKSLSNGPLNVESFVSNAFGMFDVHGNVWEWCRDYFLDYDAAAEDVRGARPGTSAFRVLRGGSFGFTAWHARSADRNGDKPGSRYRYLGFRPSLDLP